MSQKSVKEDLANLCAERETDKQTMADLQLQILALSQQQQSRRCSQRAFSVIPLPESPRRSNPLELGLAWRAIFFTVAYSCQVYFILYAATGDRSHRMRGQSFIPISAGSMLMFLFASPRGGKWVEMRCLGGFSVWLATFQIAIAVGHIVTNPSGDTVIGYAFLSMLVWFDPVVVYLFGRMRKAVAELEDDELSSYLLDNLLFVGIPGFAPLLYLSMDTFNCLNAVDDGLTDTDDHYDECSGILVPQFSISFFFFFVMVCNIIIAPLSDITLKAHAIMELKLGFRLTVVLMLVSFSAIGNIFLFANMYEGRRTPFVFTTALLCGLACCVAAILEMIHIVYFYKWDEKDEDDDEIDLFEVTEESHHKRHLNNLQKGLRGGKSSIEIESSGSLEYNIKNKNLMTSSISDGVGF
ncbi:hypothetical protein TL16_g01933 [Triparma laevis f. inornata]|uniref:Uncharacterized protein n=2 Tax=Triparma laevis TaxID=1534972 RepID=A0A9W7AMB6_9STRA|nr:hypothetical protein TL16_g01933 [Triparma laevis f. inornata]GMH71962.1 hypothetical protein TrLO_g6937 [Triparma laevis f. longispina]